ncbi:MAG: hypothetical protein WKG32_16085 [Gemmatimonadaceae bacterium]
MKRLATLGAAVLLLSACPKDRKTAAVDSIPIDTTPVVLESLQTAVPPPAPDTFTPPKLPTSRPARSIPAAPPALMEAVEREQAFTKFCYQEFGLKADPTLRGGVTMVVTVGGQGITGARVARDNWSGSAGKAVNRCLNEKASQAWKLAPGAVRAGQYTVLLSLGSA